MRYAYQNYIQDGNGRAVSGAIVTVYKADTTTLATIYAAKSGGSAISGSTVTTSLSGYFIFYIDNADYPATQLFDITPSKSGYSFDTISDVSIIPMEEGGFYYPDYLAADHGITGASNTIKYYVDLIGTTNKATIYLRHNSGGANTDYIFGSDKTIPSNITLNFEPGARIAIATGITVTIGGPFEAGLYQVFDCVGTGAVAFNSNVSSQFYVDWFHNPSSSDWTVAIQRTLDSLNIDWDTTTPDNCAEVVLPNKRMNVSDTIVVPPGVTLTGGGMHATYLLFSNDLIAGNSVIEAESPVDPITHATFYRYGQKIKDFSIWPQAGTSTMPDGISLISHFKTEVSNIGGYGMTNAIHITSECNGIMLRGLNFRYCDRGIYLDNSVYGVNNTIIENCALTHMSYQGIYVGGALNTIIENSDLEFCGGYGYQGVNIDNPLKYYSGSLVVISNDSYNISEVTLLNSYIGPDYDEIYINPERYTALRALGMNARIFLKNVLMDAYASVFTEYNRYDNIIVTNASSVNNTNKLRAFYTLKDIVANNPTLTITPITNGIAADDLAWEITNPTGVDVNCFITSFSIYLKTDKDLYSDIQDITAGVWVKADQTIKLWLSEYFGGVHNSVYKYFHYGITGASSSFIGYQALTKQVDISKYADNDILYIYFTIVVPAGKTISIYSPHVVSGAGIDPLYNYNYDYITDARTVSVMGTESGITSLWEPTGFITEVETVRTNTGAGNLYCSIVGRNHTFTLTNKDHKVNVLTNMADFIALSPRSGTINQFIMQFTPTVVTGAPVIFNIKYYNNYFREGI